MKQKRLMLLGGLSYLIPVIEEAHKLGAYVITADYLPNNIAHKYSDEYCNVSIVDKEAVLALAIDKQIDGIMSFAVDPGVVTAAYVAEKMGLPFQCSYKSACILQNKALFREFLSEHGFNCPKAKGYTNADEAIIDADYFNWPVIVKPVDSAGSKGVTKVSTISGLQKAIEKALDNSISKQFIIEDFLEKEGYSAGAEVFSINGKIVFYGIYDQYFDNKSSNPYTPSAEIWPSSMCDRHQSEIVLVLQRLFSLLNINTGIFNIEFRLCKNNLLYIMEVSPRGGGNRLAEMLKYATKVNLIEAETKCSLGFSIGETNEPIYDGNYMIYVLHSNSTGIFKSIYIDPYFEKKYLLERQILINKGDLIGPFSGANKSIGTLFLRFANRNEVNSFLRNINKYINIIFD